VPTSATAGDWYRELANGRFGKPVSARLGLPRPARLRRYQPGRQLTDGPVLVASHGLGRLAGHIRTLPELVAPTGTQERLGALVLDLTGADDLGALGFARELLAEHLRRLSPGARVLVLGSPADQAPAGADGFEAAATRQAVDGLVRSLAKELRDGATANLVLVDDGADVADADSAVRFLLSARSAYVDGQPVRVGPSGNAGSANPRGPAHTGRVVLVTGAARGIGAAIAGVFARDGATVVGLDVPAQGEALTATANRIGGLALQLDVTAPDAPARLAGYLTERFGGVDVVVHNAGITRDKLLANMDVARWDAVLGVNLRAQLALNEALLDGPLRTAGRIVSLASTSGIAGNRGQTNYSASKAGVIGLVRAMAPALAGRGITVNAVAPGFIETEMTAAMPLATREAGRRVNSLLQGGQPVDVAETVAWLAEPGSGGITGQVVRVCGQSMVGA
jgi:3-oxoacyl-[acyl-carrier protein] reductase